MPAIALRPLPLLIGLLLLAAGPAWAGMAPIRDYVNGGRAGERDHSYPLMRCGALYMASLKAAEGDVDAEKAEKVMQTAMKMIAIASSFRMKPGDDPTATTNAIMDDVERMVAEYGADGGSFGSTSLVKQDFKYCRNFAEPFARNYNMDPPPVPRETPLPPPVEHADEPAIRPGDMPGAPLPH
jgi:hypothetical protein